MQTEQAGTLEAEKDSTHTTTQRGINSKEWEAACNQCGDCCRGTEDKCPHLIGSICTVYPNREFFQYCMTVDEMRRRGKMPEGCGYQNIFEGVK